METKVGFHTIGSFGCFDRYNGIVSYGFELEITTLVMVMDYQIQGFNHHFCGNPGSILFAFLFRNHFNSIISSSI